MNAKQNLFIGIVSLCLLLVPTLTVVSSEPSPSISAYNYQDRDCGIDLVMVLDSSGSITDPDFQIMKTFVTDLVRSFELGDNAANIGIVQFSTYMRREIALSDDITAIENAIDTMYKLDRNTNITSGLHEAEQLLLNGRSEVPKVIIVLTDGLHNSGPSPVIEAAEIRGNFEGSSQRVEILGVAVGDIKIGELVLIADGDQNVIQVPDFAGLQLIKSILYDYSCAVVTGTRSNSISALPTAEPTSVNNSSSSDDNSSQSSQPTPTPQPSDPTVVPTTVAAVPANVEALCSNGQQGKIAFASDRDGDSEIFVMDQDGQNVRQLTFNEANDDKPSWNADGSVIAFESDIDGDFDIYTINNDGTNVQNITNNDVNDWGPSFSPDGSMIAFHSARDGDIEIFVMNADGSNPRQLTFDNIATDRSAEWKNDNETLVYFSDISGGRELYTVNVNSGDIIRLTTDDWYDGHPEWSMADDLVVFSSTRSSADSEIFVMNSDGTHKQRLTHYAGTDDDPTFSEDGTYIAFESTLSGNWDIWAIRRDGSNLQQLTFSDARDWSADWACVQ